MQHDDGAACGEWKVIAATAILLLLSGAGCDQAGELVDDVRNSVSESMDSETDTAATADTTAQPPEEQSSPSTTTQNQPNPEQVLAEFKALRPEQVSDAALSLLVASPEAASQVTEITTSSSEFGRAGIELLAKLENLQSIVITAVNLSSADLVTLADAKSLTSIGIPGSGADDSVVAALATLPNLEGLDLSGTKITDAVAPLLAQMSNLKDLDLRSTGVDDNTVMAIANHSIRSIDLGKTNISNASVPFLLNIPTLKELDVSFNRVTGDAFKGLNRTSIRKLNVGETPFGIEGFANMKGMRELEDLNVYNTGLVQHRKVDVFTSFPKLKILNAGGNAGLADPGMHEFFKGHKTLESLTVNSRQVTDNGLAALVGVKTLKRLFVNGTSCTSNGALALKQRLPDCEIHCNDGQF